MDFTTAVKIIMRDIDETLEIINDISGSAEPHLTEIELIRARLHSAKETLALLPRMSASAANEQKQHTPAVQPVNTQAPRTPQTPPVENHTEQKTEPLPAASPANEIIIKEQPAIPEIKAEESVFEIEEEKTQNDTPVMQEPAASVTKKEQEPSKAILADKFSSDGVLGEKIMTSKTEGDVASTISSKPITDITGAIGINDRFYYIRELFGNNSEEYSKTLSRLNKASSLDEAMTILDKSIIAGPDNEAYSSFTDIIKRKFPVR